jgi:hypothetical protein
MHLAVIACPNEEHDFDGKIYLTRVARMKTLGRDQFSNKLIDELIENEEIHRHWREFVMTISQCLRVI